ncbi:MAG TPA: hypothetical protein DIW43_11810 [Spongiibacteraceae bacterium]|nr:hypothetical protein [Spongiibacteraceae bacterium]HCS28133.1 hypothetical protein [Spongiibacteraceae bacterium]
MFFSLVVAPFGMSGAVGFVQSAARENADEKDIVRAIAIIRVSFIMAPVFDQSQGNMRPCSGFKGQSGNMPQSRSFLSGNANR